MQIILRLLGFMPIVLVFADPIADPPNGNIPVKSQSNFANTEIKELTPEFDNNTTNIIQKVINWNLSTKFHGKVNLFGIFSQDILDIEDRNNRPQEGSSNFLIRKLNITKNNLVRVVDLDKEWKLSYDVTIFKMPAYDQKWLNLIHLTTNGNAENDNIFNLCMYRNGLVGKFSFHYWTQKKEMYFALGQTYHVVIEVFKTRRGRYGFAIILDGIDLVHKNLKDIKKGLQPQTYYHVKVYGSNPWQPTLKSSIGALKNLKLETGLKQQCCNIVVLRIAPSYLTASRAGAQKDLVGEYVYKGLKNGYGFWVSANGKQAIWYLPDYQEWCVGSILSLGTIWRGLSAGKTTAKCPTHNRQRWNYFDLDTWKTDLTNHIHLQCKENFLDYYNMIGKEYVVINLVSTVSEIYSFN